MGSSPGGQPVAEGLVQTNFNDTSAPAGNRLYYAVVATRQGRVPSPAGQAEELFLPALRDVTVRSSETDLVLSWQAPQEPVAVRIRSSTVGEEPTVTEVTDTSSFRVNGVEIGRTYRFELTAVYLTSEGTQESAPVTESATPRGKAKPVMDLAIDADTSSGGYLEVRWSETP